MLQLKGVCSHTREVRCRMTVTDSIMKRNNATVCIELNKPSGMQCGAVFQLSSPLAHYAWGGVSSCNGSRDNLAIFVWRIVQDWRSYILNHNIVEYGWEPRMKVNCAVTQVSSATKSCTVIMPQLRFLQASYITIMAL